MSDQKTPAQQAATMLEGLTPESLDDPAAREGFIALFKAMTAGMLLVGRKGTYPDEPTSKFPDWFQMPPGLKLPTTIPVMAMLFKAEVTASKTHDRQCLMWAMNMADKRIALQRAGGDQNRAQEELAKQCVRVIDGVIVDHSGVSGKGKVDQWWDEIGEKCRQRVIQWWAREHTMSPEQSADFFENCVALIQP